MRPNSDQPQLVILSIAMIKNRKVAFLNSEEDMKKKKSKKPTYFIPTVSKDQFLP